MNRHYPVGRRLRSPPSRSHGVYGGERSHRPTGAFTLIEVIMALGILGGGLVAVMAMFAPLAEVRRGNEDTLAAAEAAVAVKTDLRQKPWVQAVGVMTETFLVSRTGERVGRATDPVWTGHVAEEFFAVTVLPNEELTGPIDQATLPWLALRLRVRWPVTASGATGQRELFVPGSIHR